MLAQHCATMRHNLTHFLWCQVASAGATMLFMIECMKRTWNGNGTGTKRSRTGTVRNERITVEIKKKIYFRLLILTSGFLLSFFYQFRPFILNLLIYSVTLILKSLPLMIRLRMFSNRPDKFQ